MESKFEIIKFDFVSNRSPPPEMSDLSQVWPDVRVKKLPKCFQKLPK